MTSSTSWRTSALFPLRAPVIPPNSPSAPARCASLTSRARSSQAVCALCAVEAGVHARRRRVQLLGLADALDASQGRGEQHPRLQDHLGVVHVIAPFPSAHVTSSRDRAPALTHTLSSRLLLSSFSAPRPCFLRLAPFRPEQYDMAMEQDPSICRPFSHIMGDTRSGSQVLYPDRKWDSWEGLQVPFHPLL